MAGEFIIAADPGNIKGQHQDQNYVEKTPCFTMGSFLDAQARVGKFVAETACEPRASRDI